MDDSVTENNLKSEMTPENQSQKVLNNQKMTEVVDSDISLIKHSNGTNMLKNSQTNLRVAMIKQAKMINHSFKTVTLKEALLSRLTSNITGEMPYKKKIKFGTVIINKKKSFPEKVQTCVIKQSEAKPVVEQPEMRIKVKQSEPSTSNEILKESLLSKKNSLVLRQENNIEMNELEELKKHNSDSLCTTKSVKRKHDTLSSDDSDSIVLTKIKALVEEDKTTTIPKQVNSVDKAVEGSSLLKSTLVVRKPFKPTIIMNELDSNISKLPKIVGVRSLQNLPSVSPFVIPRSRTSISMDANKIRVVPYLKPKMMRQQITNEESKIAEKTGDHKFPNSITVKKAITLNPANHDKTEFKPFRANIGGRFVTLRRMKTSSDTSDEKKCCCAVGDPGACKPPCSTIQQTTKMCVRKAPDGTYRVTNNNFVNTNGLTIKKLTCNSQNNEHKKVDPLSYRDDDNQPSTSRSFFTGKIATMTSSDVPPKEINDDEQFVVSTVTMPIKYNKQQQQFYSEKISQDFKYQRIQALIARQQNTTMLRRNTCFVPKPREPVKQENCALKVKTLNGITIRRNTVFNSQHQEKASNGCYTIPQSLLSSKEQVVQKIPAKSSECLPKKIVSTSMSPTNGEDLFLIEDSPPKRSFDSEVSPTANRRKAILEPMKTFSDEITPFENSEDQFIMTPRPRQNSQLVESLARYRTIVRFILNHLRINQIDFNTEDYISLYKFNRG